MSIASLVGKSSKPLVSKTYACRNGLLHKTSYRLFHPVIHFWKDYDTYFAKKVSWAILAINYYNTKTWGSWAPPKCLFGAGGCSSSCPPPSFSLLCHLCGHGSMKAGHFQCQWKQWNQKEGEFLILVFKLSSTKKCHFHDNCTWSLHIPDHWLKGFLCLHVPSCVSHFTVEENNKFGKEQI